MDLGACHKPAFGDPRALFLLPWLHTYMNMQRTCGRFLREGDSKGHTVAVAYGYLWGHAKKLEDEPTDTHKKSEFDKLNILCMNVHLFSEALQSSDIDLFAPEAPALLLDYVKSGSGGETFNSFRSLLYDLFMVMDRFVEAGKEGPDSFGDSLACMKIFTDVFFANGCTEYGPAVLRYLMHYLVTYADKPHMQQFMREVGTARTEDMAARDGPYHGLDDFTEMQVRFLRKFITNTTADNMDIANYLRSGPGKHNDAAVNRMMGTKPVISRQRDTNKQMHAMLSILWVYAEGRPGKFLDPEDPRFNELWSFCGKEKHDVSFGTHRVVAHGREEKHQHAANMAAGGEPMPVRRSPFVERDQKIAAKEKKDREAVELAMLVARERAV